MTATDPSRAAPNAAQVSPDDLLASFSQSHLVRWFLMALLIHAVVIGGFSVGTIRDWVDPEGAKARKEAAIAAAKAAAETAAAEAKPAESAANDAKPDDAKPDDAKPGDAKPGDAKAEVGATASEAKTPIEKATTEAATPEEIPTAPDELGLSIEDTNPN
jgi:hypothetical protein